MCLWSGDVFHLVLHPNIFNNLHFASGLDICDNHWFLSGVCRFVAFNPRKKSTNRHTKTTTGQREPTDIQVVVRTREGGILQEVVSGERKRSGEEDKVMVFKGSDALGSSYRCVLDGESYVSPYLCLRSDVSPYLCVRVPARVSVGLGLELGTGTHRYRGI